MPVPNEVRHVAVCIKFNRAINPAREIITWLIQGVLSVTEMERPLLMAYAPVVSFTELVKSTSKLHNM